MKTVITLFLSAIALTHAFTTPSVTNNGKAVPRLSEVVSPAAVVAPKDSSTALNNALREFANWNDVWDGDGGYGGYGMGGMGGGGYGPYQSGYRRGGNGGSGLALRRDIPSRDVSSSPVLSGSDVWRDDWSFPMTSYNRGSGGGMRRYGGMGYGGGGMGYGGMGGMGYGGGGMGYGGGGMGYSRGGMGYGRGGMGYGGGGMGYGGGGMGYGGGGYGMMQGMGGGYGRGGYGGYGGNRGGGYGGYGMGYGGGSGGYGGYGLGYSNSNNYPETREFRARRRYSRDQLPGMY